MNSNNIAPTFYRRVFSVWYRHFRVYTTNFYSNAFPPFLEPLIYLAGLGLGITGAIQNTGTLTYPQFLASGLIVTSAMFAASMECTYGTFVRLEYDLVYDGMLGAPLNTEDLVAGEILFVATKGFFFSLAVLCVVWLFGIIHTPLSLLTCFVGFITGLLFGSLSMFITSKVTNINHFNFFFTGLISPMFFFSGVVFPLENLPKILRFFTELIPLTHVVRISRYLCAPTQHFSVLLPDFIYCIVFSTICYYAALKGMKKRLIQ